MDLQRPLEDYARFGLATDALVDQGECGSYRDPDRTPASGWSDEDPFRVEWEGALPRHHRYSQGVIDHRRSTTVGLSEANQQQINQERIQPQGS